MARKLDTRNTRHHEPITTLGETPAFRALKDRIEPLAVLDEARRQKALTAEDRPEPSHVERHRPNGPRIRDGEPAASFASEPVRVEKDGHMWQVTLNREVTEADRALLHKNGFEPVDDEHRIWNASQKQLVENRSDINVVALKLAGKQRQEISR